MWRSNLVLVIDTVLFYTYKKSYENCKIVLYFSDICQLLIKSASKVAYGWFLNIGN